MIPAWAASAAREGQRGWGQSAGGNRGTQEEEQRPVNPTPPHPRRRDSFAHSSEGGSEMPTRKGARRTRRAPVSTLA